MYWLSHNERTRTKEKGPFGALFLCNRLSLGKAPASAGAFFRKVEPDDDGNITKTAGVCPAGLGAAALRTLALSALVEFNFRDEKTVPGFFLP